MFAFAALAFDAAALAAQTVRPEGAGQQSQQPANIPPQCLVCHDGALITQQRLSRTAWSRELDKMIRWGAVVPAGERERMLDALAKAFSPSQNAVGEPAPEPKAPEAFTRACLTCHAGDLIAQQRLTRAGWLREVEKMIRWGAPVSETEKAILVEFLADRYPVR